jgi:hypothetical protein
VSGSVTISGANSILVNLSAWVGGAASGLNNTDNLNVFATVYIGSQSVSIVPSLTCLAGFLICSTGAVLFTGIAAGTYTARVDFACSSTLPGAPGFLVRNPTLILTGI